MPIFGGRSVAGICAAVALSGGTAAHAQAVTGTIVGRVTDTANKDPGAVRAGARREQHAGCSHQRQQFPLRPRRRVPDFGGRAQQPELPWVPKPEPVGPQPVGLQTIGARRDRLGAGSRETKGSSCTGDPFVILSSRPTMAESACEKTLVRIRTSHYTRAIRPSNCHASISELSEPMAITGIRLVAAALAGRCACECLVRAQICGKVTRGSYRGSPWYRSGQRRRLLQAPRSPKPAS